MMKFNEFQADIGGLETESPKLFKMLNETINTIPMVRWLISDVSIRGLAKDRPKMEDGKRIIVDVVKPHILEDMDYFRERALYFQEHGKYTDLYPSKNPFSEYAKFWREEKRRFEEGYVRESDGEWIPGYLYFYWNYSPIWLVEAQDTTAKGKKQKGKRVRKFPLPYLGDYLFYHYLSQARDAGQHAKLLKSRGIGFSFKAGSMGPCNMIVYPGSGNPNFYLASDKGFLSGDKGIFGKVVDALDWLSEHTPFPRVRLVNSIRAMEIQLGYLDSDGKRQGALSSVYGISLKDNPDKARGIRGPFILYEEDGLFPNLEKAWNVNRPGMEAGSVATGLMIAGGTGGTEGASFEGSKKLFYSPSAYNIYGVPDYYNKNTSGLSECGFFWGAYLNRENYTHVTGEPDVIGALIEILKERVAIIAASNDPAAITQKKAEHPLTPDEAIMRTGGSIFPVADIGEYLINVNNDKSRFLSSHYVGKLVYESGDSIKWLPDPEAFPIRSLDITGIDRGGAPEIFEMPKYKSPGQIQPGRYIAGIDPIDQDEGQSLLSVVIMDLYTDRIVAQYIGRHPKAEQCYEEVRKLLIFYNAKANYENNLKGLFSYFKFKNSLYLLADTPEILKDMEMMRPTANTGKGTRATAPVNAWGRQLQVSWLLTQESVIEHEDEEDEIVLNLHRVRSLRYLEEAQVWNADGNYDMVSAMGMLFIYREEMLRQVASIKEEEEDFDNEWTSSSFFGGKSNSTGVAKAEQRFKRIKERRV